MSVIKFNRNFSDLFNWDTSEQPTTEQEYQNAVKNWTQTEMNLVDTVLWQPETAYSVGNIAKTPSLPSQYILVCTEAGDSGVAEPDYTGVSVGDTVVDGTVTWLVSTIANGGNIDALTTAVEANTQAIGEHSTAIAENTANVATNTADIATNTANIATNTSDIANNTTDIEVADKRISNIEKLLQGNLYDYQTDSTEAYTKTVPAGAMPYAGLEQIGGKTIVYNQLLQDGNFALGDTTHWKQQGNTSTIAFSNGVATVTLAGTPSAYNPAIMLQTASRPTSVVGHKYLLKFEIMADYVIGKAYVSSAAFSPIDVGTDIPANVWTTLSAIVTATSAGALVTYIGTLDRTGAVDGSKLNFRNIFMVDLTLMFGSGNEPTTVAEFTAQFPASYYPYNAGTLLSAGVTSVVSNHANLINPANYYPTNVDVNGILTTRSYGGNYGDLYTASNGQTTAVPLEYISKLPYLVAGTYTLAVDEADAYIRVYTVDNAGNVSDYIAEMQQETNKSATFTLASNTHITLRKLAGGVSVFKYLRLTKSGSALPYSPYGTIATYPIPAEIQALEGYGWSAGSVYNYIDYERKVFVQQVGKIVYNGTETWRLSGTNIFYHIQSGVDNSQVQSNSDIGYTTIICDKYAFCGAYTPNSNTDKTLTIGYNTAVDTFNVAIHDSAYVVEGDSAQSITNFKTFLSGNNLVLYYPLATPIETDISAYITDDNLIEVEAGGTLTFPNSNGDNYRIPVPSEETYMINLQEAVSNG